MLTLSKQPITLSRKDFIILRTLHAQSTPLILLAGDLYTLVSQKCLEEYKEEYDLDINITSNRAYYLLTNNLHYYVYNKTLINDSDTDINDNSTIEDILNVFSRVYESSKNQNLEQYSALYNLLTNQKDTEIEDIIYKMYTTDERVEAIETLKYILDNKNLSLKDFIN